MKTIPKRADIYSNMNDKNQNMQKQMSELLQMKNILNSKLQVLTKTIGEDIYRFTNKNYPRQIKDLNLMNLQNNLFGTDRTFGQFSIDFKDLMLKLQTQVKGVVEVLQKFSFTKNISLFISNGIMDGFLKLNDLMLRRQEFCTRLMHRIQQSVMNGSTIFSKHFGSNNLCTKCGSSLQKDKVISTKQSIILGGSKISNIYHKQLFYEDQGDEESNQETDLYGKITKIRGNIKTLQGTDPHEIKSQQDIRHNLERLQSNIEQRKYDILACLMEMGQFGSSLIKSSEIMENIMKHNSITKEISKFSDLLPSIHKLPPKFNFKEFTFDVSKHFYKEIKDIEVQLSGIKTKYKTLLQAQFQQSMSKQIQCDIGRQEYEKQMEKYKKKTERHINSLNERIAEIEKLNKGYKQKIEEYESALKSQIFSKLDGDINKSVENVTVQKRISQLVDQYEKKIKIQQKQLKSFRDSKLDIQSLLKAQDFKNSFPENPNQSESSKQFPISENEKQHLSQIVDKIQNIEVKKKISLFLQPIMRKLSLATQSKKFQNSFNPIRNQSEKNFNFGDIAKFVSDKSSFGQNLPRKKRQSIMQLKENEKGLRIFSGVFQVNVTKSKFGHVDLNLRRTNTRPHQRKQSQVLPPRQIQILTDKDSNKMLSHFNDRQNEPKMKQLKGPKLTKVKSQENTKIDKIDRSYQDKMGKKVQLNYADGVKKYSSQHDGIVFDKKTGIPTTKNLKQKASKKALKALSLTILKKGQQEQPKSSIKLPSLSQYQKPSHKLDKMKPLQKAPQMSSKSNLLMKKKRKKRNFSQQTLAVDSLFNNHEMTMSLGNNLQKQIKSKAKKQYIIDFIPKIQQSNVSKCKQDQKVLIEGHISDLFDIKQVKKAQVQLKKTKKGKYFTKTMHTKDNDDYMTQKLKKQQIQLSTKLYSLMATLKSTNFAIYKSIRQKLRNQFDKKIRIKTNCDHISMTMDVGQNSVSHLPLSLSLNQVEMQGCESSFQLKKQIYQSMSTNSNDVERNNDGNMKNQDDKVKEENQYKPDSAQLNKIINFLIVKHRNMCQKKQKKQEIDQKSTSKVCDHLLNFYQSLVNFTGKSPSQSATVQKN